MEKKIKSSRIGFISNYFLGILALVSLALLLPYFSWERITSDLFYYVSFFAILLIGVGLIEYPEWQRIYRYYLVDNLGITKIEGIIRKRKNSIPYSNISNVELKKGVLGRIFNFGDIIVHGFNDKIVIEKVRNPDIIYDRIKGRIKPIRIREKVEKTLKEDVEFTSFEPTPSKSTKEKEEVKFF